MLGYPPPRSWLPVVVEPLVETKMGVLARLGGIGVGLVLLEASFGM